MNKKMLKRSAPILRFAFGALLFGWPLLSRAQSGTGGGAQQQPIVIPAQPATVTTSQIVVTPYAPTPAGQPLGGGNVTNSSSMPKVGGESDTFDLLRGGGGAGGKSVGSVHGDATGAAFFDAPQQRLSPVGSPVGSPASHRVQKGDTLWRICDTYFHNPYQWPRIWSLNPQIQNPHWIEPGDDVKLRSENGTGPATDKPSGLGPLASLVDRRRNVAKDSIFLRDVGFIDESNEDQWGEINGAAVDKMFLSPFDVVYLKVEGNHEPKPGQELTVFRPVKSVPGGKLVQIQGTVKIDQYNASEKIARAVLLEANDVVERGAFFGPVPRKLNVVPPVVNPVELDAKVIASIHPHVFYGQNQVVFINKGAKDGLVPGNRLLIRRQGDAWGDSLATKAAATRIALESDSPAQVERVPTPDDRKALPAELVGELRVVTIRDHSSACIVTTSTREIELGDHALAKKGY